MKKFLMQHFRWSSLLRFQRSFLGRALIVLFLVAYVLSALNYFSVLPDIAASLRLMLNGAVLFLVGSGFVTAFCPSLICHHEAPEVYLIWMEQRTEYISAGSEFSSIEKVRASAKDDELSLQDVQRALELGDLSTLCDSGVEPKKAMRTLAQAHFLLLDVSRPYVRLVTILLLGAGLVLTYIPLGHRVMQQAWGVK